MNKPQKILFTVLRFAAALILLQTLAFKFTAHPDSVALFTTLGLEPYGRIGIGIMELIAGALLIYTRFAWLGAILGMGLMAGAPAAMRPMPLLPPPGRAVRHRAGGGARLGIGAGAVWQPAAGAAAAKRHWLCRKRLPGERMCGE